MKMVGFCSENSKLKVFIAKDEKQISLRISFTEALQAVHTSECSWCGMVWYRIWRGKTGEGAKWWCLWGCCFILHAHVHYLPTEMKLVMAVPARSPVKNKGKTKWHRDPCLTSQCLATINDIPQKHFFHLVLAFTLISTKMGYLN